MSHPKGPRLPPVESRDERGAFLTYPGKSCTVCSVQLTSRNRYDHKLLCKVHGKEHERNRIRSRLPVGRLPKAPKQDLTDPYRQKVHDALASWLNSPDCAASTENLKREMDTFAMNTRFKALRAAMPKLPMPVGTGLVDPIPTPSPLAVLDAFDEDDTNPGRSHALERTQ